MNFLSLPKEHTNIETPSYPFEINYQTSLLFLGSCFSENIGTRLQYLKFPVSINPLGTIYNPISIVNSLKIIKQNQQFSKNDLKFSNQKYFHYLFNTNFSDTNPEIALKKMNATIKTANIFLKKSDIIFITLGTSFAYRLNQTNTIVSNCHKQTSALFTRILLDFETITKNLEETIQIIGKNKKIIFTVSPIRHLKDGLVQNSRSKAQLISAVHLVIEKHPNTFYFPSFEIMMDDLRDYRYYDESLTHLSKSAIQYIFHHFANALFDKATFPIMTDIDKLNKLLQHKTTHLTDNEKTNWEKKLENTIKQLAKKYPFLDFSEERVKVFQNKPLCIENTSVKKIE